MRNKKVTKTPTVLQIEAAECGAACLSMILQYYGKHVSAEKLREMVDVSRDGSKAGNLMRTGQTLGMEVHGYRKEVSELYELQPPCIIHWNFNHFVVYEGIKGEKVYLNDPAVGRRRLKKEEFENSFTGIVLTFQPGKDFQKEKGTDVLAAEIRRTLKENKSAFLAIFLIGLLLVLPGFLTSALAGFFVQTVLAQGFANYLSYVLLGLTAILIFEAGFRILNNRILRALQNKVSILSTREILEKMFRLPVRFFELRFAGDLSSRLNHNAAISQFLTTTLTEIAVSAVEGVVFGIILFVYSPLMTAIVLAGLVLQLWIIRRCSESLREYSMKQNREVGKMTGMLYAGLTISDSLKTSGGIDPYLSRLLGSYSNVANMQQKTGLRQKVLSSFPRGIMAILQACLILTGGLLVMEGKMPQHQMIAFLTLFAEFLTPIQKISAFAGEIHLLRADVTYIYDITGSREEAKYRKEIPVEEEATRTGKDLSVTNLTFGYRKSVPPLIENFSLSVGEGEMAALVGASGSGKSTVAKLISGLLEPWGGEIVLGGSNTKELPNEVIALNMATVSQNIHLFEGTIRDNLTLWNRNCAKEDIIAAAKDACIHSTIMKKRGGYDYFVSRDGNCFSGGERQRLEIARALVNNPGVLILDEATSALDPVTEAEIMNNIRKRGCTCIIAAHRLSTVRDCKEIILLQEGKIVARGSHEELYRDCKEYRELIQLN